MTLDFCVAYPENILFQDVEDILKCNVCLGDFNDNSQRPLLLPACGHTFCASCLESLQKQSRVGCPECRKVSQGNIKLIRMFVFVHTKLLLI